MTLPAARQFASLVDLVQAQAALYADEVLYRFLPDGETETATLTYGQFAARSRAVAAQLQQHLVPQDRVLIVMPYVAGSEFVAGFFGCLLAQAIAVSCNPPRHQKSISDILWRVKDAQAKAILMTAELRDNVRSQLLKNPDLQGALDGVHWIAVDEIPSEMAQSWREVSCDRETLAYFQYSSGTTGNPKAVMLTHGNVLHNSEIIFQSFGHKSGERGVIWMPLFHDMGLVGGVIQPLYAGLSVSILSPIALIQKPHCWLQTISRNRATTSGGPNFAYDLACQSAIANPPQDLDLSSWEVAFTGAEPIRPETLARFTEIFTPYGFKREAFYPCYGMAETTLLITGGQRSKRPILLDVDAARLAQNEAIETDNPDKVQTIVGCGHTWLEDEVIVVNPDTLTICPDGRVGEIWFRGPGLGVGYWQRPEETEKTFQAYVGDEGPYLRTGDLGFRQGSEIYITGRLKDLMIFLGRNHYPQYIESTVENCHQSLRVNGTAAFAIEAAGDERLIIVQEVERTAIRKLEPEEIIRAIRQSVGAEHIIEVFAIALIKPGALPRTSSGKVQRRKCRQMYLAGDIEPLFSWQLDPNAGSAIMDLLRQQ
ncbi:MAG: fatty acyl-AMP ligase [Cyanobacteria bacterium P01_H01_bin.15]